MNVSKCNICVGGWMRRRSLYYSSWSNKTNELEDIYMKLFVSVQCVIMINLFKYVHITKIQRQEYKIAVIEKSRTALSVWYTAIKLFFTSYCYKHILRVFNIMKRRHILSVSVFCLKQNQMHHLQSFISFCKKKKTKKKIRNMLEK